MKPRQIRLIIINVSFRSVNMCSVIETYCRLRQLDMVVVIFFEEMTIDLFNLQAALNITSPHNGVIKTLYYKEDAIAIVGKPLVEFELTDGIRFSYCYCKHV